MRIFVLTLSILFVTINSARAQEVIPDTDSTLVIREYILDPLTKQTDSIAFDTTMQEFHFYNPAFKHSFSNTFLGNTGQAFQTNYIPRRIKYTPFIFIKPIEDYFHNPYNISHFNTYKPFTQVEYVSFGNRANSEQVLKGLHSQNVNEYINFGALYDLIASKGIYDDQDVKANRITIFGSYKKDDYSAYSNINLNKHTQVENGGLSNIPEFLQHTSNVEEYAMNLQDAESKIQNKVLFLTQNLDIFTGRKDTSSTDSLKKKESLFHVNHTFTYSSSSRRYTDVIPGDTSTANNFYRNSFYMTEETYDSAAIKTVENSFQISGARYKFLPGFIAGFKHQYVKFHNLIPYPSQNITVTQIDPVDTLMPPVILRDTTDTIISKRKSRYSNDMSVFFSLLANKGDRFYYNASFEYFFSGYKANDIVSDFLLRYSSKNKKTNIAVSANFYLTEPDFFLKDYNSSHFYWNNTLRKTSNTGAAISFDRNNKRTYAKFGVNLLGNYIYADTDAIPRSAGNPVLLLSALLEKRIKWKGFNLINEAMIQKVTDEDVIQVPLAAFHNTTYYENAFFKNELKFQIGFDFYYHTAYYADTWMPATGMFYRQDEDKVGNYPFIDAFLNWKIKRTRFFLKYTNSLSGIAGYNYFTAYRYPMNERALKFGLSWTFYD